MADEQEQSDAFASQSVVMSCASVACLVFCLFTFKKALSMLSIALVRNVMSNSIRILLVHINVFVIKIYFLENDNFNVYDSM